MSTNHCVCCGAEIPEGRQVCLECEMTAEMTAIRDELIREGNAMLRDFRRARQHSRVTLAICWVCAILSIAIATVEVLHALGVI